MTQHEARPRILVVVNVFHPDRGGGGAIFSDLCYGLAERGFDVTVRCAYPYYPEWRDKSGLNGWHIQRYEENGVHVERHGLFIPRNPSSLLQRLTYEASFLLSLCRSLPRGTFDHVMVYCPLAGAVAYGVLHKWLKRQPFWLNVQDLSADAAKASGIASGASMHALLSGIQRFLFNQADTWSSISPAMIERLEAIRAKGQPIHYLPNWLNASLADAIGALPDKYGRPEKNPPHLLYAGNIGAKQDLLRLLESLHRSKASFSFAVNGDGGAAPDVRAWIERTCDPRFTYGHFLPEPAFAQALHEADYFVIPERTGSGGSFIPCKTIAGLASHTPILAVCDNDSPLGQEVIEHQLGPHYTWDELDELPGALNAAGEHPRLFYQWQTNCMRRAEFYRRERLIDAFAQEFAKS